MTYMQTRIGNWSVQLIFAVILSFVWTSCGQLPFLSSNPGNKYRYQYKLTSPAEDSSLVFRDEFIYVQFKIDDAAIKFQLQNISPDPLEIYWSKASIGVNGRFFPVRHSTNLYAESLFCNTYPLIPSLGYTTDLVMPAGGIYYDGTKWKETDLLPTADRNSREEREKIERLVGTPLTLMLPVQVGETAKEYRFTFVVSSVTQIPWDRYLPPRRPPPPIPQRPMLTTDQMIVAGVVVGVIGLAAYWLTLRKIEPSP